MTSETEASASPAARCAPRSVRPATSAPAALAAHVRFVQAVLRDFAGAPERTARRPNSAPFYYLGRPAGLWITAMRPHRGGGASRRPMQAVRDTAA